VLELDGPRIAFPCEPHQLVGTPIHSLPDELLVHIFSQFTFPYLFYTHDKWVACAWLESAYPHWRECNDWVPVIRLVCHRWASICPTPSRVQIPHSFFLFQSEDYVEEDEKEVLDNLVHKPLACGEESCLSVIYGRQTTVLWDNLFRRRLAGDDKALELLLILLGSFPRYRQYDPTRLWKSMGHPCALTRKQVSFLMMPGEHFLYEDNWLPHWVSLSKNRFNNTPTNRLPLDVIVALKPWLQPLTLACIMVHYGEEMEDTRTTAYRRQFYTICFIQAQSNILAKPPAEPEPTSQGTVNAVNLLRKRVTQCPDSLAIDVGFEVAYLHKPSSTQLSTKLCDNWLTEMLGSFREFRFISTAAPPSLQIGACPKTDVPSAPLRPLRGYKWMTLRMRQLVRTLLSSRTKYLFQSCTSWPSLSIEVLDFLGRLEGLNGHVPFYAAKGQMNMCGLHMFVLSPLFGPSSDQKNLLVPKSCIDAPHLLRIVCVANEDAEWNKRMPGSFLSECLPQVRDIHTEPDRDHTCSRTWPFPEGCTAQDAAESWFSWQLALSVQWHDYSLSRQPSSHLKTLLPLCLVLGDMERWVAAFVKDVPIGVLKPVVRHTLCWPTRKQTLSPNYIENESFIRHLATQFEERTPVIPAPFRFSDWLPLASTFSWSLGSIPPWSSTREFQQIVERLNKCEELNTTPQRFFWWYCNPSHYERPAYNIQLFRWVLNSHYADETFLYYLGNLFTAPISTHFPRAFDNHNWRFFKTLLLCWLSDARTYSVLYRRLNRIFLIWGIVTPLDTLRNVCVRDKHSIVSPTHRRSHTVNENVPAHIPFYQANTSWPLCRVLSLLAKRGYISVALIECDEKQDKRLWFRISYGQTTSA
jgi:hypothetical protein